MLRDGFLRFCDDPDIACCRAEAELGKLRIENGQLYAELAELQELAQAKAEGRLIILPCKVGDVVYMLTENKTTKKDIIDGFSSIKIKTLDFWCFDISQFGKTVFFTREAAEKAIGGGV